jgi:hypothetical protein
VVDVLADVDGRAALEQEIGDVEPAVVRHVVQRRRAAEHAAVHVGAGVEQRAQHGEIPALRRIDEQTWIRDELRLLARESRHRDDVTAAARHVDVVLGLELFGARTGGEETRGDRVAPLAERVAVDRAPVVGIDRVRVGGVAQQELDARLEAERDRHAELVVERRARVAVVPVDRIGRPESVREQQLEPLVAGRALRVVGALPVVRIRPRRAGGSRARARARAAAGARGPARPPDRAGQRREAVGVVQREGVVRVGSAREQQRRGVDGAALGRSVGHARVGEVEERRPAARTAARLHLRGIGVELLHERRDVTRRRPLVAIRWLSRPWVDIDPLIGPECPLVLPTRGWILFEDLPAARAPSKVRDLERSRLVRLQARFYVALALLAGFGLPFAIGLAFDRPWGGMLWGGLVRTVFVHHCTFLINSAAHFFGRRPYSTEISARDNGWLALLSYGEGYHNFHHAFPGDYRNGIAWYQWTRRSGGSAASRSRASRGDCGARRRRRSRSAAKTCSARTRADWLAAACSRIGCRGRYDSGPLRTRGR